jgi:hypothetical protein
MDCSPAKVAKRLSRQPLGLENQKILFKRKII